MAVMVEIVSRRVEFYCGFFVFVKERQRLSFCEVTFGQDFVHQAIGITSGYFTLEKFTLQKDITLEKGNRLKTCLLVRDKYRQRRY